ncbi:MAG TPA: hypothetical protein VM840_07410 [Actinomycetota bacterium]|nr:hypothetical protein [Actinomycetota bacterium]
MRSVGRSGPVADHDSAWERAEAMLRDSLCPHELETYERHGWIEVPSRLHPGRVYRVDGWRPVAVFSSAGTFEGAICLRPRENLPSPDVIVAHKLYIQGAEEEFLRAGNWLSPAWRPTTAAPTVVLMLFLFGPWLLNLMRLGPGGIAAACVGVALLVSWGIRRMRTDGSRPALSREAPPDPAPTA